MTGSDKGPSAEPGYEVVWPLGRRRTAPPFLTDRLGTLDGKRIGFVWDYLFRGDEMFRLLQERLVADHPDLLVIDRPAFGNIHGRAAEEQQAILGLPAKIAELEVDAAVVGVGA